MFYLILRENLQPRSAWPADLLKSHLAWADREVAEGGLVFSGPADGKTKGVYLLKASDLLQACAIADRDPIISGGYCNYKILDWDIQRGVERLA
jgi:uncharacterized protein YciI